MADILKLSNDEIESGAESLVNSQLTASQVEDLVSIFRGYLGALAGSYSIESTLLTQVDDSNTKKCAKLAACLNRWQEGEFDNGGFAATVANKTGFNFSLDSEQFQIFQYAFGLFWDLPDELASKVTQNRRRVSGQGRFINTI